MTHINHRFAILIAALASIVQSAYAQQPPDIVTSDGYDNTASGTSALQNLQVGGPNNEGTGNSAFGSQALSRNTTGSINTAVGVGALISNTTGTNNSALGYQALGNNVTGGNNTAIGVEALIGNTAGNNNTAVGVQTFFFNTSGSNNTATGYQALFENTTGDNNTATGYQALSNNVNGKGNVAQGVHALNSNEDGIRNIGIGNNALYSNNGSYNIALGADAGHNVTTGSNNIEIGASGTASDDATIRIGVQGTQTKTTIAGIYGTPITGSAVYVTSTGRLGVLASSERYKTDIATMPDASAKLAQLRPVTFHYKSDPKGARQYGLIAEEVGKVYPELVISDESGKIQGVHYEELAPMLLNEIQKQQRINTLQAAKIDAQAHQITALNARVDRADLQAADIRDLKRLVVEMQAGILKQQSNDELVARR